MTQAFTANDIQQAGHQAADLFWNYLVQIYNGQQVSFDIDGTPQAGLAVPSSALYNEGLWLSTNAQYNTDYSAIYGQGGMAGLDQGTHFGDCWLLASIAAVAGDGVHGYRGGSALLASMIDYSDPAQGGNGSYSVTFPGFSDQSITVSQQMLISGSYGADPILGDSAMWARVIEAAMFKLDPSSVVGGQDPQEALYLLTGQNTFESFNAREALFVPTVLTNEQNDGQALVAFTTNPGTPAVVRSHAYTVVSYDSSTDQIILRNPWGGFQGEGPGPGDTLQGVTDIGGGEIQMSMAAFTKYFYAVDGTTPLVDAKGNGVEESATASQFLGIASEVNDQINLLQNIVSAAVIKSLNTRQANIVNTVQNLANSNGSGVHVAVTSEVLETTLLNSFNSSAYAASLAGFKTIGGGQIGMVANSLSLLLTSDQAKIGGTNFNTYASSIGGIIGQVPSLMAASYNKIGLQSVLSLGQQEKQWLTNLNSTYASSTGSTSPLADQVMNIVQTLKDAFTSFKTQLGVGLFNAWNKRVDAIGTLVQNDRTANGGGDLTLVQEEGLINQLQKTNTAFQASRPNIALPLVPTVINGNSENFLVAAGSGNKTIANRPGANATVTLSGSNVNENTVAIWKSGNNLQIGFIGTNDVITIKNEFGKDTKTTQFVPAVSQLQLPDGKVLTSADINSVIQNMASFGKTNHVAISSLTSVEKQPQVVQIIAGAWH